jgi:hypothetical protein
MQWGRLGNHGPFEVLQGECSEEQEGPIHTARKSFATKLFLSGLPAISIMNVAGTKQKNNL